MCYSCIDLVAAKGLTCPRFPPVPLSHGIPTSKPLTSQSSAVAYRSQTRWGADVAAWRYAPSC